MRKVALDFPKSICLETCNLCNGSCVFCPYPNLKTEKILMPDTVVYRLIDEISEHSEVERFSLFNNNEPMLDKRIRRFVEYAKKMLPNVRQTFSSNGRILNAKIVEEMIDAGVDRFFISIPSLDIKGYNKLTNFDLEQIMDTINAINEEYYPFIRIAAPKTIYYNEEQFRQTFTARGIKVIPWGLEVKTSWTQSNSMCEIGEIDYGCGCDRPLDQAIISANGDVLICCRDWYHENVVGNINNNTLSDVWRSEKAKEIQELIINEKYDEITCCKDCSRTAGRKDTINNG